MKPYSIKYIGSAQACAPYVPFAKNKVKNVVEKERKGKSLHSRSYTFSNGAIVKCTATKREFSILIQAALGGLIFIGRNDTDPTIRVFQSDGFTNGEFPNILPSALSPYLAPFPTVPDDAGLAIPKYDWRNDLYTVFAGAGLRYSIPLYDKDGPEYLTKYFGYTAVGETNPTVCDKSGNAVAQGIDGSGVTGACINDGYCIGITLRGEIRAWALDDPDTIITHQITLPSWIGNQVTLETSSGSGIYHVGYQGWLDGESGIEWKFNKDGTKAIGLVYEIVNYGEDGTGEVTGVDDYWKTVPHILIVTLNMVDNTGITFTPSVITSGQNLGICAVDWYALDDSNNTISYTFLNYYENIPLDQNYYQLQFITNNLDLDTDIIHDSFNLQVRSNSVLDWTGSEYELLYFGKVTGVDMRYHTYSYDGTDNVINGNDINYARGFDLNEYKNQIGNVSVTDDYFNLKEGIDTGWSGSTNIFSYFENRHNSVQYHTGSTGSSCAAMENNKKRFAYMGYTANNTGEFYDVIQRDTIISTHENVFNKLGYTQDTDIDGQVNSVFHTFGVFI